MCPWKLEDYKHQRQVQWIKLTDERPNAAGYDSDGEKSCDSHETMDEAGSREPDTQCMGNSLASCDLVQFKQCSGVLKNFTVDICSKHQFDVPV